MFTTCQFLSLTVCFYIQRQRGHSYLVNREKEPKWIEINQSQIVKAVEINYLHPLINAFLMFLLHLNSLICLFFGGDGPGVGGGGGRVVLFNHFARPP